ncbi:MAG: flagellar biosynthesis protein FliQ [Alphaproteobacteria bacterium]|nr:flagellar biosynthesis protein FliQ [Alphaproteobacteria bacterium]
MNEVDVIELARAALYTLIEIAAPVMLVALAVGITIALFQALTQMQEMTLAFVPKILLIFVSLIVLLPFMMSTLVDFAEQLFQRMTVLGA